ncbi:MAG: hypothetical protein MZW92_33750 [Comamonadaceae bacterium]|nr:hypothetical protein [Comamonadaceae bacterium]
MSSSMPILTPFAEEKWSMATARVIACAIRLAKYFPLAIFSALALPRL